MRQWRNRIAPLKTLISSLMHRRPTQLTHVALAQGCVAHCVAVVEDRGRPAIEAAEEALQAAPAGRGMAAARKRGFGGGAPTALQARTASGLEQASHAAQAALNPTQALT